MNIAFLGTGLMGHPMARRLLEHGHHLFVYNRTPAKARSLGEDGARVTASAAEAVASAEAVVVMLSDAPALWQLLEGIAPESLAERTIIQMSTIAPEESLALSEQLGEAGAHYLEAPVLGSIPQATNGSLIVMVGAERELFERWRPVLEIFGPEPRLVGPVGRAAVLKLALNQLIAALTAAFSLSLGLVQRNEVPVELFMEVLRQSALYAPTFDKKLRAMLDQSFAAANFPARHLLKDLRLCADQARRAELDASTVEALQSILERAVQRGFGDHDYSVLYDAVIHPEAQD